MGLGWLVLGAITLNVSPVAGQSPAVPGVTQKIVVDERAGGFRRSFRLHLPAVMDETPPLVVALHGGFANGRIMEQQSNLSRLADREGFVVAYPNGLGILGLLRHWNGGYCCAKAMKDGLDDVGFIDRVVEWVAARHTIDGERVYVIGYSNGGMIAYDYAAKRADRLAGLGIWASSIGSSEGELAWSWTPPDTRLPVFIAHGLVDDRLLYGASDKNGQARLGAKGSAVAWVEVNGCGDTPEVTQTRDGAVHRMTWCAGSPEPVVLLSLEDWGHDWPGPHKTNRLEASQPLHGFDLAAEMWTFFSRRKVH